MRERWCGGGRLPWLNGGCDAIDVPLLQLMDRAMARLRLGNFEVELWRGLANIQGLLTKNATDADPKPLLLSFNVSLSS